MFLHRFMVTITLFVISFSSAFSSNEPNTNFQPSISYYSVISIDDSTITFRNPELSEFFIYNYHIKTVVRLLDGSIHTAERSKIVTHKYYKISSINGFADTLEQVFLYPCGFLYKELTFGILNSTDTNTESSTKKFNGTKFVVPMHYYSSLIGNSYKEYPSEWFENNIGTYMLFGYQENNSLIDYNKLSNLDIQNRIGTVSNINGKEFTIFGKPIYLSPSTKFYDEIGNAITLENFTSNDRIDIDYVLYNNDKYIALRITKLPRNDDVVRYSEDVLKVSNDTIYTTSHILKLSSIQSKKDINGDDIDTDSLFAQYRAITFEISSNEDRNEIRNVDFVHSTYRQRDSNNFRGTAIGMINSLFFPSMTLGVNLYEVGNGALIRNKFGDTTLANSTTIPLNSFAKLYYERVEDSNGTKYVVNFISLEDTSTFSSVTETINNQIKVFPNPITNGFATIEFKSFPNEQSIINIISSDGNVVVSKRVSVQNGINSFKLDVRSISNGVYFVEITDENKKQLQMFPIQILR